MDAILRLIAQYLILLCLFGIIAVFRKGQVRWKLVGLALAIEAADYTLNFVLRRMPPLTGGSFFLNWNWSGKLASAVFFCTVLACSSRLRYGSGVTGELKPGAWKICLPILIAIPLWAILINLGNFPDVAVWPTVIYQGTLPSTEELFFRGMGLYLMSEALGSFRFLKWRKISYAAVITCIWFGLAHAIQFKDGQFDFNNFSFGVEIVAAALFLTLRYASGNIWLPILGHSLINIVYFLPLHRWLP